jgi:pimeloyl-ACP methyl ester carboxylesterase
MARVLLVLHDETSTGPAQAAPLVERAREAGWVVVAPTLEYGEWAGPDDARAAAGELLPSLRELVEGLDQLVEQPTRGRIFLYGHGRGGQVAQLFALFYPELVRGVATADAVPCTLPRAATGPPGEATVLAFPDGIGDLENYRGQPANFEALSRISFWIQPSAPGGGDAAQHCAWLGHPADPRRQLERFTAALAGIGAELQLARADQPDPGQRALQFLADLPVQ